MGIDRVEPRQAVRVSTTELKSRREPGDIVAQQIRRIFRFGPRYPSKRLARPPSELLRGGGSPAPCFDTRLTINWQRSSRSAGLRGVPAESHIILEMVGLLAARSLENSVRCSAQPTDEAVVRDRGAQHDRLGCRVALAHAGAG